MSIAIGSRPTDGESDADAHPQPEIDSNIDLRELAAVAASLESKPASKAIEWAVEQFREGLVLASSFQDCVLIDLAHQVDPGIEVVFLDTQYHFAETLWYVEHIRQRYDLNLRVVEPEVDPDDRWLDDPDGCCGARKVVPLAKALSRKEAWMTGLRRDEASTRSRTPIVAYDVGRGLVKVNPLATWTGADVAGYSQDRALPEHPLRELGYTSIGCWPCTRPVEDGEDPRAGRWSGLDKLECGLHE
ncbi:MAG: phosphoadenylyl-sulfate reductase [Acidimicrobiia bacterium]|jgi:phosphoadenosine phosphosulfate reductase